MIALFAMLATTLSSSDIGEFFSLGTWLDPTVSAEYTYGSDSDDEPRERWVIRKSVPRVSDVGTVSVPSRFAVYREEINYSTQEDTTSDVTTQVEQPSWIGSGWYIGDSVLTGDAPESSFVDADRESGELTWVCDDYPLYVVYSAIATRYRNVRSYTVSTNLLYTPKAHVLGPENQAAVLSSFAGWMERCYYAGLGMSNAWDVAAFGPTNDLRGFRFDVQGGGYHYVPTNRVIDTRRLVEGGNIYRLFRALKAGSSGWDFRATRPSWGSDRMLWAFGGLDVGRRSGQGRIADRGLAECVFGWTHDLVGFPWEDRVVPLATAYHDVNGWGGVYYSRDSENPILRDALHGVFFGEPENSPYLPDATDPKSSSRGRMRVQALFAGSTSYTDILTNVFPRSCDIVSDSACETRSDRLFAEQLGISCQSLSLLDRSYYEVSGFYEFAVTNRNYTALNTQHGTVHANVSIDIADGTARLDRSITREDIAWGDCDNYAMTTNAYSWGYRRSMYSKFSGTRDGATDAPLVLDDELTLTIAENDIVNVCESHPWVGDLYDGTYDIVIDAVTRNGPTFVATGYFVVNPYTTRQISIPLSSTTEITGATLHVDVEAHRNYRIDETLPGSFRPVGGLNHPGPLAYDNDKVATNLVLGISGYSVCDAYNADTTELADDLYGATGFDSRYSTRLYDFTDGCTPMPPVAENQTVISAIRGFQRSHVGHDPIDEPAKIIPIGEEELDVVKSNLLFVSGRIEARKIHDQLRITVAVRHPTDDVETPLVTVEDVRTDGSVAFLPLSFAVLHVHFPNENNLGNVSFSGSLGPRDYTGHTAYLQQVDWKWSTLKLTRENNP